MGTPNRWQKKTDSNQADIVLALKKIGCSVFDASLFGGGFPDLVVGRGGMTWLMEVKQGKGQLNAKQTAFHSKWCGHIAVVRTPMEAINVVNGNG